MSMVSRDFRFNIDLSALEGFVTDMDTAEERFKRNAVRGMQLYTTLAEEGSRALAHRDEGTLEASIEARLPIWVEGNLEASVSSNLAYALRRHEDPYSNKIYDKNDAGVVEEDYYEKGLGRRSREKEPWRGMKPGRKFMARAVDATGDNFEEIMAEDVLNKTLRGG